MSKARREEIENLDNYNYLLNHIDDLQKLQVCSMVNEGVVGYNDLPF